MRPEWAGYTSVLAFISFRKKNHRCTEKLEIRNINRFKSQSNKKVGVHCLFIFDFITFKSYSCDFLGILK